MLLFIVAVCVIIALLLLTRRKPAAQNLEPVAPPARAPLETGFAEIDDLNRAARERRRGALNARWWNV